MIVECITINSINRVYSRFCPNFKILLRKFHKSSCKYTNNFCDFCCMAHLSHIDLTFDANSHTGWQPYVNNKYITEQLCICTAPICESFAMNKLVGTFLRTVALRRTLSGGQSFHVLNRQYSYKSDLALETIYPNSSLRLYTPPPPAVSVMGCNV